MAPHKNTDKDSPGEGGSRSRSNSDAKRGGGGGGSVGAGVGAGVVKDSDVYKKRRERNNIAVRKSRQLSRQKAKQIDEKVRELRDENRQLEDRVQLLHKELSVLKDLFMSSAPLTSPSEDSAAGQDPNCNINTTA